jgi:hypothetical protein
VTGRMVVLRGDAHTPADLGVLINSGAVESPRATDQVAGGVAIDLPGGDDAD